MSKPLSLKELELLRASVTCVSQFDITLAQALWGGTRTACKKRLQQLENRRLLKSKTLLVSEPPGIHGPLYWGLPSEKEPDIGAISYRARTRYKHITVEVKRVYTATGSAFALFGREPVKPPKALQATHDLGLTASYLYFRSRWPRLTETCWRNESEYARFRGHGVKVEDAMLVRNGEPVLMVDWLGTSYTPHRLAALFDHSESFSVPIMML